MSLRSSCRAVESVPVTVFPNLLSRKHIQSTGRRQTWRSRGHQLHVEHRISSVLCRSEVGSFRNLRGTNWLVVWAEQDAGQEFQEAPEASPPPHHQTGLIGAVMNMSTSVQIFFAALFYVVLFFGASIGDDSRRGPPR